MVTKFYYGEKCSSCEPILFDRRNAKHPNGFVFGLPGAGKTYAVKHEICQVIRKTSDPIIIIDECGEYSDLATGVNPFYEASKYHINPLDVYIGDNSCESSIPYGAALTIFEELIGRPLETYECAAAKRACNTVFEPFIKRLKAQGKRCDYAA